MEKQNKKFGLVSRCGLVSKVLVKLFCRREGTKAAFLGSVGCRAKVGEFEARGGAFKVSI